MVWHTPESAAKHIHVRLEYVTKLINSGELESHLKPSGRGRLIPESALDKLVMSWPSGAKAPFTLPS